MKTWLIVAATALLSISIVFGPDIRSAVHQNAASHALDQRVRIERQAYDLFSRECSFPATWEQSWCRDEYVKRVWFEERDGRPCGYQDQRLREPLPGWLKDRAPLLHQ